MTHSYSTRRRRTTSPTTAEQTEQPAQLPEQGPPQTMAKPTSGNQNKNDTKMSQSARKSSAQTVAAVPKDGSKTDQAISVEPTEAKTTYEMPSSDDCPIFLRSE